MACGNPELSIDALEEAVTARTALRIVSIQMDAQAKPVLMPASWGHNMLAGFTLSSLCCGRCYFPCVPDMLNCHTCGRVCNPYDMIFIPSLTSGLGVVVHEAGKVYMNVGFQFLFCLSCRQRLLLRDTPCKCCQSSITPQSQLYLSPPYHHKSPEAIEAMVRDVFKAEISEYEA